MTEFTKEYIALLQRLLENSPYKQIQIQSMLFKNIIDEIKRLQERVEVVENNREHIEMLLIKSNRYTAELEQHIKNHDYYLNQQEEE